MKSNHIISLARSAAKLVQLRGRLVIGRANRRPSPMSRPLSLWSLLLTLVTILTCVACGNPTDHSLPSSTSTSIPFEALSPGPQPSCADSVYGSARLVEDPPGSGRLWFDIPLPTRVLRLHPVWPAGYRLVAGSPPSVVDGTGRPVVHVGDEVPNLGACDLGSDRAIVSIPGA